jgi:hypothetical protein
MWAAFTRGDEKARWWSWQQNSQALVARLDQGKLDQEAAIRDLPLPRKAGLQLQAGSHPRSQPGARALSTWLPLPLAGSTTFLTPNMGPMVYLFCPAHPQQTLSWPWDVLLPSSPSLCTSLSPFYLLGRGRGKGTGRKRFTVSWGKGVTELMVYPPSPGWVGRLNKERNSRDDCFI